MDARQVALDVLNEIDKGQDTLDFLMDKWTANIRFPFRKDRSLLNAIVFGVTRWRKKLDHVISHFSNTPFENLHPVVRNVLRMGLFQIQHLDRIPVSAAVNTSVDLAKANAHAQLANFVNAVLRKATQEIDSVPYPDPEASPVESMAVEKSFPEWLIERWFLRFGMEETGRLCDSINQIAPITVRVNTLRTNRDKLVKSLEGETGRVWTTSVSEDGVVFSSPKRPLPELAAFRLGWFQVQDEAAQLATRLLEPLPGEKVLDACAGLGGKTGYIAQMMENRGRVAAMDIGKDKLARLVAEMDRLIIKNATPYVHDFEEPLRGRPYRHYDRILLDAPCSGLGVLRRNPDSKWRAQPDSFADCARRQGRFLDNLSRSVKSGGTLVYVVCSMEPEETDGVVDTFLESHPEFTIKKPPQDLLEKAPSLFTKRGFFRSYPHLHDMDGFFAAGFTKK